MVANWKESRGSTPGLDVGNWIDGVNEFWVAQGNSDLTDFNYAAETYDAVMVIALAAAAAGTDGSALGNEINGITTEGEKCTTFADCLAIIDAGGDPDYDGISGPLNFNGNGEPLSGSYAILEFQADNRLGDAPREVRRGHRSRFGESRPGPRRCRP